MSHRPNGGSLTAAEETFCIAYVGTAGFNAAAAARLAYPNIKDLDVYGSTVLRRPKVAAYVANLKARANKIVEEKFDITIERIAEELAKAAFFDPIDVFTEQGDVKPLSEIPARARQCIAGLASTRPTARRQACVS